MAYTHIDTTAWLKSHDFCECGDCGGHVVIEDHVTVGALSPVHQFCRIGGMRTLARAR